MLRQELPGLSEDGGRAMVSASQTEAARRVLGQGLDNVLLHQKAAAYLLTPAWAGERYALAREGAR